MHTSLGTPLARSVESIRSPPVMMLVAMPLLQADSVTQGCWHVMRWYMVAAHAYMSLCFEIMLLSERRSGGE